MLKSLFATIVLLAGASIATAQDAHKRNTISVVAKAMFPTDTLSDRFQTGWSAGIASEARIREKVSIIGELSYGRFDGKGFTVGGLEHSYRDLEAWHLSLGARAYPARRGLYVSAAVAYDWFSLAMSDDVTLGTDSDIDSEVAFIPGVGVRVGIFDLGLQYRLGSNTRWAVARVAVAFF